MGWFDEQIKARKQYDDDVFAESFFKIAGAVLGKQMTSVLEDETIQTRNAIERILKYYHIHIREFSDKGKNVNEQLEYLLRPHGIMQRDVELSDGWNKDAFGGVYETFSVNRY